MGMLSNLGASLGIGAMSVRVTAPSRLCAGETLQGVLHILGGKVDQHADGLAVGLRLEWETTDDEGRKETRHTEVLKQPLAFSGPIAADSLHEIPFSLSVPAQLALAPKDHWHTVFASVDIPSAVDAAGTSSIRLYPPRPQGTLLQDVSDELGWILSDFDAKSAPQGQVRALFHPPKSLQSRVDRLRLDVCEEAGSFQIHAMLDLKEGLWKALTKQDEHFAAIQGSDAAALISKLQGFIDQWTRSNST